MKLNGLLIRWPDVRVVSGRPQNKRLSENEAALKFPLYQSLTNLSKIIL